MNEKIKKGKQPTPNPSSEQNLNKMPSAMEGHEQPITNTLTNIANN